MLEHTEYCFCKDRKGKNEYWKCYCTVHIPNGSKAESRRASASAKTKKESREKLEAKISVIEIDRQLNKDETKKTTKPKTTKKLNTLSQQLYTYAVKKQQGEIRSCPKQLKPGSVNDKHEIIRNLIEPYKIGSKQVGAITHDDVINWLKELKDTGKKPRRRKGAFNILSDYYIHYYCIDVNPDYKNPTEGIDVSTGRNYAKPDDVLDDEEIAIYLNQCEREGSKADVLKFLLLTGCRVGEATTLQWQDLIKNNIIHIHNTWTRDEKGKRFVNREQPKTESSDRPITLSIQVIKLLEKRYEEAQKNGRAKPGDWIFPALKDSTKPMSESAVRTINKRIYEESNLKYRNIHKLRHTHATYIVRHSDNKDKTLAAISISLGHSNISTTADYYLRLINKDIEELANLESDVFARLCG